MSTLQIMISSSDMLIDLVKMLNLLAVIILHQKFTFYDICTLEFALQSINDQTCQDDFIDAGSVSYKVLITLKEDLNFRAEFNQMNIDLTILIIIYLFNAHSSPSDQLAAVYNTLGFITAGQIHHKCWAVT